MERTMNLYVELLKGMRCAHPDVFDILLDEDDPIIQRDQEWRQSQKPKGWTENSIAQHMSDFTKAGLRWESACASEEVERSPSFQASRGSTGGGCQSNFVRGNNGPT
eukprot:993017-Pyramimonas_sp.AAC.1